MSTSDLFSVTIEFDRSHLFFPHIIEWALAIMFVLVCINQGIPYLREVRSGSKHWPWNFQQFHLLSFFGTLLLTVIYFILMDKVGELFPNMGMGFMLMSIPYMFLLSLLYLHQRDRRHVLFIGIISVLAPILVWFVLARLFYITLP